MKEPKQRKSEWTETDDRTLKRLLRKFKKLSVPDPTHDIQFVANLIEGKDGEEAVNNAIHKGEVKRDYGAGKTGNVFVEFSSRGKPSGISTTEADFWIVMLAGEEYNDEVFIGVKTDRLKRIVDSIKWEVNGGDNRTSKGKLVPVRRLIRRGE